MSDRKIEKEVERIMKSCKIFQIGLIALLENSNAAKPDIEREFHIFEGLFYSTFTSYLDRYNALNCFTNYFSNTSVFENNYCETKNKEFLRPDQTFGENLGSNLLPENDPSENTLYDERSEFSQKLKYKFDIFKNQLENQIISVKNIESDSSKKDDFQSFHDEQKKGIEEIKKYFDRLDPDDKWGFAFRSEEDVYNLSKILNAHFNDIKCESLIQPIYLKPRTKIRISKKLREIHMMNTKSKDLRNDSEYIKLLQSSVSLYSGYPQNEVYNCLVKDDGDLTCSGYGSTHKTHQAT